MNSEYLDQLKFDERGLICCITQDDRTDDVLMVAYMNAESLALTLETGFMHYYSRSRRCLWKKGETSGHVQRLVTLKYDCDGDALLAKVFQTGPACHTGNYSCFFRDIPVGKTPEAPESAPQEEASAPAAQCCDAQIIGELFGVIADRKIHPKDGSYTNYLFNKGLDKILKKVGEEASEVIIAAKNEDGAALAGEAADLIYHLLVMLCEKGLTPTEVFAELAHRR